MLAPGMLTGAALNPPTSQLVAIPGGIEGVKATLAQMVKMARAFKTDLNVNQLAVSLVSNCPSKDYRAELVAIQHFCRDQIRYTRDVEGVETLRTPVQTLKLGAGDCDDKSILFCSLAGSVGFPTRFCAIGVRGEPFSHVMPQARLGSGWINCETIVAGVEIGWFPPDATDVMLAHV